MEITKMHGLGNDFILIDNREGKERNLGALAKRLCQRRLSVGADGLMAVENSASCPVKMRIINADGSEAEMCGNGIRCFARFVYDRGIVREEAFDVETLAGTMRPGLIVENGQVKAVRVDMGVPSFARRDLPMLGEGSSEKETIEIEGERLEIGAVLMGVPHAVYLTEDHSRLEELGPRIETHPIFPKKTNVNFCRLIDRGTVAVSTWERGAGATLACGTGASGTVALLHRLGLVDRVCTVKLKAGDLLIECAEDGRVFMTGPAAYVFEGRLL